MFTTNKIFQINLLKTAPFLAWKCADELKNPH